MVIIAYNALESGSIRVISDYPFGDDRFNKLSKATFYSFKGSNAFNTSASI